MNRQRFDEETLTGSLQLLAEETASLEAPPEVEQKLRETFRARAALTAASRRNSRYWLAAVAAVLLIVMSVIALRSRPEPPKSITAEQTQQRQLEEQQPIVVEPKLDQAQPKKQESALKPRRPSVRRVRNNEVANHVNSEIATDFMPLGYLNPATLQDGGQIIRVEVPRSALVNFGLPVNMNRYHEKVKADVLLGVDGVAHAIRFVQ